MDAVITPTIGTVSGTFLTPGMSKNGRLYTRENIAAAVNSLNKHIADGSAQGLTHHSAEDDSLRIVAKPKKAWQEDDGSAKFEAAIANTSAGRDIAALVSGKEPFLNTVSIRGSWVGDPSHEVAEDGTEYETGDAIDVIGIDFTKSPGVSGAKLDKAVFESFEVTVEADTKSKPKKVKPAAITEAVTISFSNDAMTPVDPDGDGDIDGWQCPTCGNIRPETNLSMNPDSSDDTQPLNDQANDEETSKEKHMAETKEQAPEAAAPEKEAKPEAAAPVTEAAPTTTLSETDITAIAAKVAELMKPQEVKTEETKPAESDQAIGEKLKAEIVGELVKHGVLPQRKGILAETEQPSKPLHEMSTTEFKHYARSVFESIPTLNKG